MLGTELAVAMDICKDGCRPEKRDPCSSPPCKRLKQACISFETINSTKEIIIKPNGLLSNQATPTNPQVLPTNQHYPCQHGQFDHSDKTNPPIPSSTIDSKDQLPSDNTKNNSGLNLPESPKQVEKSQINSPPFAIKDGSILSFTKPVTPGHSQNIDVSKTPSKECEILPSAPSTPVNKVVSPTTPVSSDQVISPSQPPTSSPVNTPKLNTPKNRTPGRKVSVEERLKREEEKLKKKKERESLEHERLEKKKEKERIKAEKEKEREEAKEKKEQERLEQLAQKKQREKERQEKKGQEDKEKKERLEKKEEERKKREEEKKKKEDEKSLKSEEKRKKEEEVILKKQKIQNNFSNFFIKKEVTSSPKQKEQVKNETKFQPFEIKPGMKLASIRCRKPLSEEAKEFVNKILSEQVTTSIFQVKEELQKLKAELAHERQRREESRKNVVEIVEDDDDVILIEKDIPDCGTAIKVGDEKAHIKTKLLLFHDNYRPAYFGTWRKKSSQLGPRTPFKKDTDLINYEVDSDEDWEEEEPGESLSNSEGEEEDNDGHNEEENDGENDGFLVPHGYLSDDEGVENVEDNEIEDKDATDGEKLPQHKVEDRMQRQLAKQKVWETEMKRQFKPMKPVAIGCVWSGELPSVLKRLEACHLVESRSIDPCVPSKDNQVPNSPVFNSTAMPVPEEAMPALIMLLHGNTSGLHKLVQMFRKKWTMQVKKDETVSESSWEDHCPMSKRQLERKITTIAKKERRSTMPKARWYVHDHILAQYKMEDIPLPKNGYIDCHIEQMSPVNKVGPFTPSIKQFIQNAISPSPGHNGIKAQVKSCNATEEIPMDTSPV